ncbi:hypothetical protein A2U01_0040246, partial [Trifolium medium]|nr:hypothetical protein [Trifolium medium]
MGTHVIEVNCLDGVGQRNLRNRLDRRLRVRCQVCPDFPTSRRTVQGFCLQLDPYPEGAFTNAKKQLEGNVRKKRSSVVDHRDHPVIL